MKQCVNTSASVCNSWVLGSGSLCELCSFTECRPDLNKPGNNQRWIHLERAKQRLLIQLRELAFPPFHDMLRGEFPLTFKFLEDQIDLSGNVVHYYTGHDKGVITINVIEADSVVREQARVSLQEPLRTVIGHMRHEIGHYFDFSLASRQYADEYAEIFGDPHGIDYEAAKNRYYEAGASSDWENAFVSPYASMHPWEDFAETTRCYLELTALLITATDQGVINFQTMESIELIVEHGLDISVRASEYSRDLGLPALLHESINQAVVKKLGFIHKLRQSNHDVRHNNVK